MLVLFFDVFAFQFGISDICRTVVWNISYVDFPTVQNLWTCWYLGVASKNLISQNNWTFDRNWKYTGTTMYKVLYVEGKRWENSPTPCVFSRVPQLPVFLYGVETFITKYLQEKYISQQTRCRRPDSGIWLAKFRLWKILTRSPVGRRSFAPMPASLETNGGSENDPRLLVRT